MSASAISGGAMLNLVMGFSIQSFKVTPKRYGVGRFV
jgi:hypothetical protein